MNREFNPSNRATRAMAVVAAVVATLVIHGALIGLAGHYDKEYLQMARAQAGAHQGQLASVKHAEKASHG